MRLESWSYLGTPFSALGESLRHRYGVSTRSAADSEPIERAAEAASWLVRAQSGAALPQLSSATR